MNTSYAKRLTEAMILVKQELMGLIELMETMEKLYPTSFVAGDKEDLVIMPYDDHLQIEAALGHFKNGSWIEYCAYIENGRADGRRITWYAGPCDSMEDRELLDYTEFGEDCFSDEVLGNMLNFISLKHND